MTGRTNPFDALVALLRGRVPDAVPWPRVIALANHTLLTPRVHAALTASGAADGLPPDVRDYLAFLHARNAERNGRLRAQLHEAVAALNAAGLTPVLLKGARALFTPDGGALPDRMTSDLDVAIDPDRMDDADRVLAGLGYARSSGFRGHWRPGDVGLLELRPLRPTAADDLVPVRAGDGTARVQTDAALAAHWIAHDMLKEGDLVRGRLDLRHLVDLADLGAGGIDWHGMRDRWRPGLERTAFHTQLLTAHTLFGMEIPEDVKRDRAARRQLRRRIFAARHRYLGIPSRIAGNAAWGLRRTGRILPLLRRDPRIALSRGLRTVFALRPRAKL